jgi:hypothetical protein
MKKKIYTLWWQGFNNAPDIIKVCHNSVKKNINGDTQELCILDSHNIINYVDLPGYIVDKYRRGIISTTHLSDIIRAMLLSQTGGVWLDASMYLQKPISEELITRAFFTYKNPLAKYGDITSRWECFFIGGDKEFPLFPFLKDMWMEYWSREDSLITYLLTDHLFYVAYNENKQIRDAIDACPSFNYPIDYFQRKLNDTYDEFIAKDLQNESYIKMTYKLITRKRDKKGRLTLYGQMLRELRE